MTVQDDLGAVGGDDGMLQLLDTTQPGAPTRLAAITTMGCSNQVLLDGTDLFATGEVTGQNTGFLEVFDVSDPDRPKLVARMELARPGYGIEVDDAHVYLAADETFLVLDRRCGRP